MIQIKLFITENPRILGDQINDFLEIISNHEFIDIKFGVLNDYFSALVIYKECDDNENSKK